MLQATIDVDMEIFFVIISVEMQFIYIDMRDKYVDMQFICV